jgi:hypothetical protein
MTSELHKIKNSLMIKKSQQRIQTLITTTLIIIMIKFLSNNIKFLMLTSLKSFILKTLSFKISHRFSILLRLIHDISCDILIDFVVSKIDKEKNLREKFDDIMLFITMTSRKVHIYNEIEELTTKVDVCWRKEFETLLQREKIAKKFYDRHQREKAVIIAKYRAKITQWIATRRTWKYILTLNSFLTEEKTVIWLSEMTEKNLVNYNSTLNTFVKEILMIAILNKTTSNKENFETNRHTLIIDFLNNVTRSFDHVAKSFVDAIITEMSQSKTFKKFKIVLETTKRRKIIENEFLHFDLQIMIIFNFRVVNISEKNAQ